MEKRVGFISSISLAGVTLITFVIAFLTPPISGPLSTGESIGYPYMDILSRFPRDYYWMFPAMLLMLLVIVFMGCADHYAETGKKLWSRIALLFASLAAGILFFDYFIQVSVVQPSLLNGETDGIPLLTQYNPHGVFIAMEEAGYLMLSLSLIFLAPVFAGPGRAKAALRWTVILGFILTVLSLTGITVMYGVMREYRFEIAIISIDFLALILVGIFSAVVFSKTAKNL